MTSATDPKISSLALAAQADVLMITVEMLRSPQAIQSSPVEPWFSLPLGILHDLLDTAFGPQLAAATSVPRDGTEPIEPPTLPEALAEVHELAYQLDAEIWSDEYYRMFDSSQACALNQASYIRRDKGTIIGDVSGFYNAFGWQRNATRGERPDNLLCQLEFVGVALAMASQATDESQQNVVQDALAEFARVHMHDWMAPVCYHLIDSTQIAFFGAVGQWILLLWEKLTEAHAWPVDPVSNAPLAPTIDLDDPYECGTPDLVQIQTKDIGQESLF